MPQPLVWGPLFHDTLFFIALSYPESPDSQTQDDMAQFLKQFFEHLPCPQCRLHAKIYTNTQEYLCNVVTSSRSLVEFLVKFHNSINARLGKKSDWTVEHALNAFYKRNYSQMNRIQLSDMKRLEDHALMQKVAESKECVCKIQKELDNIKNRHFEENQGTEQLAKLKQSQENLFWYQNENIYLKQVLTCVSVVLAVVLCFLVFYFIQKNLKKN